MADALFRKDIRRQKRKLTAIRKARKLRNKTPGYLILPVRGARYPGVLSITESGSSAPLYGFSPDHSRKVVPEGADHALIADDEGRHGRALSVINSFSIPSAFCWTEKEMIAAVLA